MALDMKDITFMQIYDTVKKHEEQIIQRRRWLHQHPELMFQEKETSAYIQQELKSLGIPYTAGWGALEPELKGKGTGIVADIGTGKQPCIALRTDMDALPIVEKTGLPFASTSGKMHACGHDFHMSILLGVASYLKQHESEIKGTFRLLFQPAEEGGGGARYMVAEGCLTMKPAVQAAFGMHVDAQSLVGCIGGRPGPLLGTAASFSIKLHGKGGHASRPHLVHDPVTAGAAIIQGINSYTSRNSCPFSYRHATVVTVTALNTHNSAYNVIPTSAELLGTIRALDDTKMLEVTAGVKKVAELSAELFGVKAEFEVTEDVYPVTMNHHDLFKWSVEQMKDIDLKSFSFKEHEPALGSEDFSYYGQKVPACFYTLGATSAEKGPQQLHSDSVVLDESAIPVGVSFLTYMGQRLMLQWETKQFTMPQLPTA